MSSTGNKIWQDRANNMVWIKIQGGLPYPNESSIAPGSLTDLYRWYSIVLYAR
jgi:hypothetical protein